MTDQPLTVPQVTPRPGGHEFHWVSAGCYIRIERLREHHDSITAEVWAEVGEKREHLLGGLRFNLTSPGGRASIIKALTARRNGVDWGGMMEQVSVYTLQKFRTEEPFEEVGNMPRGQDALWRVEPLVAEGLTTLLYGPGGLVKTTLAITVASLVQAGVERLGLKPRQGRVLVLDWETNRQIVNDIQRNICAAMEIPETVLRYRRCRRPLVDMIEEVRAEVAQYDIKMVIADSAVKACGGEKEAKENALPMLNALGSLPTGNLLISHKGKAEDAKMSYGSVFFINDCRHVFEVRGHREPGEEATSVGLFNTKSNISPILQPIGFRVTWTELGIVVARQDVKQMESIRGHLTVPIQIIIALKHNPLTKDQIVETTGLPAGTVSTTLSRDKKFTNLGGQPPLWGIALQESQIPEEFR